MTTNDLIDRVYSTYERYFGSRERARIAVLGMTYIIAEELAKGGDVRLENLGTLAVHTREQPETLFGEPNPNAGRIMRQVTFRDGASLRRLLNPTGRETNE